MRFGGSMRPVGERFVFATLLLASVSFFSPASAQTSTPAVTAPGVGAGVSSGVTPAVRRAMQSGVQTPGTPVPLLQPTVDPAQGETVTSRARPQYDPVGLRWRDASSFVYPSMTYTQLYDSNVFATDGNETGDFISVFSPQLQILSDWSRHEFNFNMRADVGRYVAERSEDYQDILGEATGRYDITADSNIFGGMRIARRHEDRGSPDAVRGEFPTVFRTFEPQIGYFQRVNRFTFRADGNLRSFDFHDVFTPLGKIDQDDRDRKEWLAAGTASYEIVPNYDAFVQFSGNARRYGQNPDNTGLDRDSNGFEAVAGTAVDLTGLIFGNVFAGYRQQNYFDGRLAGNGGPTLGADLTWTPTGLTTVKGFMNRTIEETTTIGNSGFFASRFGASVDHELMRNLLLSGRGSAQYNDYDGAGNRKDWVYRAATNAKYLVNRNLYVTGGYEFTRRSSNIPNTNFNIHLFLVKLEAQL